MSITFSSVPRLDDPPRRIRLNPSGNPQATRPVQNNNADDFLQGLKAAENTEKQAVDAVSGMVKVDTWQGQNVYKAASYFSGETLKTEDRYYVFKSEIIGIMRGDKFEVLSTPEPGCYTVKNVFVRVEPQESGGYELANDCFKAEGLNDKIAESKNLQDSQICKDFNARQFVERSAFEEYCTIWELNNEDKPFKEIRDAVLTNFRGFVAKLVEEVVNAGLCTVEKAKLAGRTLYDYFNHAIDAIIRGTTRGGDCEERYELKLNDDFAFNNYVERDTDGNPQYMENEFGSTVYMSSRKDSDVNEIEDFINKIEEKEEENSSQIVSNGIYVGCNRDGDDRYNIIVDVKRMVELFKHFCGVN